MLRTIRKTAAVTRVRPTLLFSVEGKSRGESERIHWLNGVTELLKLLVVYYKSKARAKESI